LTNIQYFSYSKSGNWVSNYPSSHARLTCAAETWCSNSYYEPFLAMQRHCPIFNILVFQILGIWCKITSLAMPI